MSVLQVILGFQVYVGVPEIVIFLLGALALGFAIHFFIANRKAMPPSAAEPPVLATSSIQEADEWRLKYYEERDVREKLEEQMQHEVENARGDEEFLVIEIEELKKEIVLLREKAGQQSGTEIQKEHSEDYLLQLKDMQDGLLEQNQRMSRLLEQISVVKDSEQKYIDTLKVNESLSAQVRELQKILSDKEGEIRHNYQQQLLTLELKERLNRAYDEFSILQEKLKKVESNLLQPHPHNFEYDEMQQNFFNLTRDFDELKGKHLSMLEENQRLSRVLADAEDKLRESNFQRQQLQKKAGFLEELNQNLQQVSDHNKKLENQLKRIGEIETMLTHITKDREDPHQ